VAPWRYPHGVPLPSTIPVRYTEEEAGFVSVRPILRVPFRQGQLLELILGVTGKTSQRVQQILRGGTVAYNGYRYWWEGVEVAGEELEGLLEEFPDADASRPFDASRCVLVLAEADPGESTIAEFDPRVAARRRLLRRRSFWDALLAAAKEQPPVYRDYSYFRRGDRYALELAPAQRESLVRAVRRFGVAEVRGLATPFRRAARLVYVCTR
jgi:hypothetical protein